MTFNLIIHIVAGYIVINNVERVLILRKEVGVVKKYYQGCYLCQKEKFIPLYKPQWEHFWVGH
ncbi:hypothetical protein GCM10007086_01250 [Photobacterium aphoticum]|uniref:Uncharacterized protein n=1 Tax=Photobacterium aphoticum TaxID=754436 RepID=A0A0J1GPR0_9GAMM|nr:hypothetical protein ABT58_04635 [Photobacterium aphoticum]PSU59310.1 hypothetical protein C9I90_04390 [Photobacterium aphoticum]GHA31879.1 hypothetical protein GCM10007086_01250 [Photobacterium aphoticum]